MSRDRIEAAMIWIRSSYCSDNACVEVARIGDRVYVRSIEIARPLDFSLTEWEAFAAGMKAGDFDELSAA